MDIRDIFVTHKHLDHILGALWMIRAFCEELAIDRMKDDVNFYGHYEVIALLRDIKPFFKIIYRFAEFLFFKFL